MAYVYNYGVLNKYIYGGLLPYQYDAFIITRNIDRKITEIDFYQNGKTGRKVMTLHIEYDANGDKLNIWSENFLNTDEIM